jgi:hypothetical protein
MDEILIKDHLSLVLEKEENRKIMAIYTWISHYDLLKAYET